MTVSIFKDKCHRLLNIGVIATSVTFMTACGIATTQAKNHTTPSRSLPSISVPVVSALQTHNPKVTVSPASNLVDGEKVKVTVTGFGQGGEFLLSECASVADVSSGGCGDQLAQQPLGVTNNSGRGTTTFDVTSSANVKPYNHTTQPCTDKCVLVATVGGHYGCAYTPLRFAAG
jgi:hypothetical protein